MHLALANHVHCLDTSNEDSSTPKRLESRHRLGDSFDTPVVLPGDVVQVFALSHQDVDTGVSLHAFNGRRISAARADGDLLEHALQVYGALQEAARRSLVSLGCEKRVDRITRAINHPVKVLPLASHFDVGLIHPPA